MVNLSNFTNTVPSNFHKQHRSSLFYSLKITTFVNFTKCDLWQILNYLGLFVNQANVIYKVLAIFLYKHYVHLPQWHKCLFPYNVEKWEWIIRGHLRHMLMPGVNWQTWICWVWLDDVLDSQGNGCFQTKYQFWSQRLEHIQQSCVMSKT